MLSRVVRRTLLTPRRLTYSPASHAVVIEKMPHRFLTGMHARGGFEQEGVLATSWSVVVDLVCVALLVWMASGLYMWWHLPSQRLWGWIAIVAGTAAFVVFTVGL